MIGSGRHGARPARRRASPGSPFMICGAALFRRAKADAAVLEIAKFSGLSIADVRSILEEHYQNDDPELA